MSHLAVRPIEEGDIPAVLDIYNYYIENTTVTFEIAPLSLDTFTERVHRIAECFPYLVAVRDGRVVGYAYLSPFSERAAYRQTVDLSVYVDRDLRRGGVGSALLDRITHLARAEGYTQLISVITGENGASVAFHEHHGFARRGTLVGVGRKFGRSLDVYYYQLTL